MNKVELVKHVAQAAQITQAQSEKAISALFKGIATSLKKGEDARFVGFGTFSVKKRAARTGRNPRTGATIKIAGGNVAKFRAGAELKNAIK